MVADMSDTALLCGWCGSRLRVSSGLVGLCVARASSECALRVRLGVRTRVRVRARSVCTTHPSV
jgi:hypothetical protein